MKTKLLKKIRKRFIVLPSLQIQGGIAAFDMESKTYTHHWTVSDFLRTYIHNHLPLGRIIADVYRYKKQRIDQARSFRAHLKRHQK
jgi:hypothetical protein